MAAEPVEFRFTQGETAVTWYESSPGFRRAFCSRCGSVVPGTAGDGHRFVPAGSFDADPGVVPKIHLFPSSAAAWYTIKDSLRQFDAFPNREGPAQLATPKPTGESSDVSSGSCQCGLCAYTLSAPIRSVHNCHCSRCRKALSAAHAANGFVPTDALTFTSGEGELERFELTDAKVFCKTCCSIMPCREEGRGIAVIPLGSLDSVPETGPARHISVDSKAPWFEITDSLPQTATV